jgi:demethylmenaquinone methyltransferase/2-methoxy-6-polyprenyl-1,4-benzoquinol methylase
MANRFYDPGEQRSAKVRDLFAAIAPRYDLINDLQSFGLHRWWKRRLIQLAGVRPGELALDLCCGTGDIAFALARQGARVVGLDFSAPMLAVAQARSSARPKAGGASNPLPPAIRNPEFTRGDALNLPFPDACFHIVTIGYGLRNLADFERGLREMSRVAKPGGRLLVLDFGKPAQALWRSVYFGHLRWVVPLFGKIFWGDPSSYAYIFESLKHYPAQEGVASKMRDLQCARVRVVNLLGGVTSINYGEKRSG